jgi:hypothetical protein
MFMGIWYIFSRFGMLYQEKIWQPCLKNQWFFKTLLPKVAHSEKTKKLNEKSVLNYTY